MSNHAALSPPFLGSHIYGDYWLHDTLIQGLIQGQSPRPISATRICATSSRCFPTRCCARWNETRCECRSLHCLCGEDLVDLGDLQGPADDQLPNLRAVFAEHLVKLKMKPFLGTGTKKEIGGSLLTPICRHFMLFLEQATVTRDCNFMDAVHLTITQWLQEVCFLSFRDDAGTHLLLLPHRTATDFQGELTRLKFHPYALLLRNTANRPRRHAVPQASRAPHGHPEGSLPDFPVMPNILIHDHVDFHRIVVDDLTSIWARVSRCCCMSKGSVRARLP